jgi:hypothetical protein
MSLHARSVSLSPNTPSNRPHFETPMSHNSPHPESQANGREDRLQAALGEIRDALRGLRYGSLTIQVQDGVVVQIDRTEKRRLQRPNSASDNDHK